MPAVSFAGRATVTAVIGRLVIPKAFEIFRRICDAATETCRVWRMVVLTNIALVVFCTVNCRIYGESIVLTKGGGGRLLGSVN